MSAEPQPPEGGRSLPLRVWDAAVAHPVVAIGMAGAVVAVHHLWVVHTQRHLGAFPVDDAGYLATAMRFQRQVAAHGLGGLGEVMPTETGPLVPLLTLPSLLLRPRSILAAMLVQAAFHVVSAVAVAGVVRRTAGARAALLAGLIVLGLPGSVVMARSFQYAGAAACFAALAAWGLVASERGARAWPLVAAGAAIGAMTVSRTMTVGFLPGFALATLLLVPLERRRLRNLALAGAASLVVAGPWWIANLSDAFGYLVQSGYSDVAQRFGPSGWWDRVLTRGDAGLRAVRIPLVVPATLTVAGGAAMAVRRARARRTEGRSPLPDGPLREVLALSTVVVVGMIAQLSSRNLVITSSELPLVVIGVAACASLVPVLAPRMRVVVAAWFAVASLVNIVAIGHVGLGDRVQTGSDVRFGARSFYLFAGHEVGFADLVPADSRFTWGRPEQVQRRAAEEWWFANLSIVWELDRIEAATPGGATRVVTGSSALVNGNTVLLAEEVLGVPGRPQTEVDDLGSPEAIDTYLDPRRDGRRNLVVLMEPANVDAATLDRQRAKAAATADTGWVTDATVDLPDGGRVRILVHPDSSPG